MAIEKMRLVQFTAEMKWFDPILRICSSTGYFHPEQPPQGAEKMVRYHTDDTENPYKSMYAKILDIGATSGLGDLKYAPGQDRTMEPAKYDQFLEDFQKQLLALNEEKQKLTASMEQNEAALRQLEHLDTLNVSLDDIFACKYIQVRFGRLPVESFRKLEYYKERQFLFLSLSEDGDYQWGVYFAPLGKESEIDDIFSSLYFERIHIPEYVHGTPGFAKTNIEQAVSSAKQELKRVNDRLTDLVNRNKEEFQTVYSKVRFLNESFELRRYVMVYDDILKEMGSEVGHLVGFIPARKEKQFLREFEGMDGIMVEINPPDSDKRLTIPTKLRNNWFVRPFQMFVDMYGTPQYNEIDPTPFLALTYTLLFGVMFGDLGQGLVIALLGLVLSKWKKMDFGKILTRIGLSAAFFGLVYGSVFGQEHLLDPLYTKLLGLPGKPVEVMDPLTINNLLVVAIGIGIVLLIASMLLNIFTGLKNRDWEKAVFSNNGVAGLVFYLAVLVGALSMLMGGKSLFTLPYVLGLIVLPILVIFLKEPLGKLSKGSKHVKPEGGIGSFLLEGFFELFEVVLSFVTNTMSFLRVGGFIISHAGMMAVVLTLTEMMNGAGSIVTLVLGNAFVMALEGFIVGIQALRLEFYEMFSHYFDGQGKPFTPVAIGSRDH